MNDSRKNITPILKIGVIRLNLAARVVITVLAAAFVCFALFVLYRVDPTNLGPVCTWQKYFGIQCVGCGFTHALRALLHGDIIAALKYNLMVLPICLLIGYLAFTLASAFIRGRFDFKKVNVIFPIIILALCVVYMAARNLVDINALIF